MAFQAPVSQQNAEEEERGALDVVGGAMTLDFKLVTVMHLRPTLSLFSSSNNLISFWFDLLITSVRL
jgi:hypothetical protein